MGTERVKAHFEEEAKEFDEMILKIIPDYDRMIDVLISIIPFGKDRSFEMIDLGCGTGTVSKRISDSFPNIKITCVDIAENMLEMARIKVGNNAKYIPADLNSFVFPQKYDLIVSSLALHHLETDDDKMRLYEKIFSSLNKGGMFINADVVLGSDDGLHNVYLEKWKDFMAESYSRKEIEEKWMSNYYAEDRPTKLMTHLEMLKECGFPVIDVICKNYEFAVWCAKR
ncbi:MAG: methyltransferase domain-containing protein [Methanomassiliicoccaceae archaeon]|jgi:tRNA (cmo5U34)-methyltransferase|nr:methyltransferase domain-containing protein [Methanomassiliicoccaceae archaeon]